MLGVCVNGVNLPLKGDCVQCRVEERRCVGVSKAEDYPGD